MPTTSPVGSPTRGTTAPNRLRRVDRWTVAEVGDRLRRATDPLVVDLGYGASPVTTLELAQRLGAVRADVEVVGVEIDAARVAFAQPFARPGLRFARGGFELGPLQGRRPVLVRALNVLRQYDEAEVTAAWRTLTDRLAPGGVAVEGTCDELGRRAAWVLLDADGPSTLTLATRLEGLDRPSELAERLPKTLIHRNVVGEPIHALLRDLDTAWASAAPWSAFGPRQRWSEALRLLAQDWPVVGDVRRRRPGELTVPWACVAPRSS